MVKPFHSLLLFAALLAACSGGGSDTDVPVPYAGTISQMTAYIENSMARNNVKGLSIALVDDQQFVWAQGFGYADAVNLIPATADTQFEIGSVSKLFGGTMIMQLSDQGKLDIGDPLTRYIPTFSIRQPLGYTVASPDPITIRSVLTHHSGIPGDILNGSYTNMFDASFNDKLITYLQGEYLAYPTNFMYDYSNSAVALLSTVIAAASGQTFEAYSDALFSTLGMDHSSFFRQNPRITGFQAKGYSGGVELVRYALNVSTAGSVISSVLDMTKFIKMVLTGGVGERGRVLNSSTLETMLTQTNGGMPIDAKAIGLNWFVDDPDLAYAGKLCHHAGTSAGFVSHLEILRDQKLGVVVLVNDGDRNDVCTDIAKQILKVALAAKTGLTQPTSPPPTYGPLVAWDQARLDALQGVYVLNNPVNGKAGGISRFDFIKGIFLPSAL